MNRKRKAVPKSSRAKNRLCEIFSKYYNTLIYKLCRSGYSTGVPRQGIVVFVPFSPLMRITELLLAALLVFSPTLFAKAPDIDGAPGSASEKIDVDREMGNLESKDQRKRLSAIGRLGREGGKKATVALSGELKKEKKPRVKARIIEALAGVRDAATTKDMEYELKTSSSQDVRFEAARALGSAGDKTVVPTLINSFLDPKDDIGVRLQSAAALASYPEKEVFEAFVKALEDPDTRIKNQAIVSMFNGFGGDKKRIQPHLEKMLKDKGTESTAKQYLENLGVKPKTAKR